MNVSFFIVFLVEIARLIAGTEAFPGFGWGSKSNHKHWNRHRSETNPICSSGQCVPARKCPEEAIFRESTGSCTYWTNGPWVCCDLTSLESKDHRTKTYAIKPSTQALGGYPKQTDTNSWKQKSTTENYGSNDEGHLGTPCLPDPWNRNARERPTPISSLGDILGSDWYITSKPTKIPQHDVWKKTTEDTRNKRTLTSFNTRTTNSRNRTHTSVPRIVFPTESISWTQRVTGHPAFVSPTPRTTKNSNSRSTTRTWTLSSTTTKKPWGSTTRRAGMTSSTNTRKSTWSTKKWNDIGSEEDRNQGWRKSTTVHPVRSQTTNRGTSPAPRKPTASTSKWNQGWGKSTTPQPVRRQTTNRGTSPATRKPTASTRKWNDVGSEERRNQGWGKSTTPQPVRRQTTNRGTSPATRKPTASTRKWNDVGSEERRNQGWGKSTTAHPVRSQTKNPGVPNRSSSPRTTSRTTRKYRVTTPLPNVNTYMCGMRDQRPVANRRARSYNHEYNPDVDMIHPDSRDSGSRHPYQRIVGGEEAEPFSWPWVAALYKVASSGGHRFLSAGSLINENFILTAAHVFTPDDLRSASYVVMLGTHNAQDAVAEYAVSSVLQHPNYEQRYYYHDIALLRLQNPVAFNDYVMPVCLPSPDAPLLRDRELQGKTVTVMGWGDDSFGGKSSRVLKEASFPIASRSSCNASYVRVASNRFPRGITEEMLCAGDPNGGKDACQGDSGGPLTSMERGRYTQVGIVSFGYQCGDKEFPGVYTKVAPYLSWIAENTRSIEDYINDYDYRG